MSRQVLKKANQDSECDQDIKFLLSNIRARENGLIFFLELFSMISKNKIQPQQYRIYKQQFLEKQKIYTSQIKSIGEKLSIQPLSHIQIHSFWNKLKTILRISLERIKTMGLMNDNFGRKYQQIMSLIDSCFNQSSSIKQYSKVEYHLKKRTIQALITTKHLLTDQYIPDSTQFNKIRSETFLKLAPKPGDSLNLSPNHPKISQIKQQIDANSANKLKSITRVKKKVEKVRLTAQINNKSIKKTHAAWQKYERLISDVMDYKFEQIIDKKKSKNQNQQKLYEQIFLKNINNHKIITKYVHNCTKLKAYLAQISKAQKQRFISQKKLNRGARQSDIKQQSNLVNRPKTAKKQKILNGRLQSGQNHKFAQQTKGN